MRDKYYQNSLDFARKLDEEDPLREFRNKFYIPKVNGKEAIYFCGNSLGLQPQTVKEKIEQELKDWAELGVDAHENALSPWLTYHRGVTKETAKIVGAKPLEVVMMNSLTVNLHLMLTSFYRPTNKRYKILTEAGAFSSDQYAIESQVRLHGIDTKKAIIEVKPRKGEYTIRTEDVVESINQNKKELALVLFGGINYYTGQAFDLEVITKAAHKAGAKAGFDLAHAAGNVLLKLHNWEVDFAVWCTYKYLNAGPGGVGGLFVHEKYADKNLPRMAGWWGHNEQDRFMMKKGFKAMPGAEGWQLSNAPILSMAAYKASAQLFVQAGMAKLVKKSQMLTGFMEYLITTECKLPSAFSSEDDFYTIRIITPKEERERGCQLSILVKKNGKKLFNRLIKENFVVDWRSPEVIRVAPVPLYNTFEEVYKFSVALTDVCCHE